MKLGPASTVADWNSSDTPENFEVNFPRAFYADASFQICKKGQNGEQICGNEDIKASFQKPSQLRT